MKRPIGILLLLCACYPAFGQKMVDKKLPLTAGQEVQLHFDYATTIELKTWDAPSVRVKATATVNGGQDNDAYELNAESSSGSLRFVSSIRDMDKIQRRIDAAHRSRGMVFDTTGLQIKEWYEVYVPRNAKVSIRTINGNTNIEHNNGPLAVESVSGSIAVQLGTTHQADVEAKTVSGSMYTNLPFETKTKKGLPQVSSETSRLRVNGGGVPITLETVTGDVMIRKQ